MPPRLAASYGFYQLAASCQQIVKIRLVATWYLQTCYKLLKHLASSLWIKSLDNQLAASLWQLAVDLLSSRPSKQYKRILILAWWQQGNEPAAYLLQLACFWLCTGKAAFIFNPTSKLFLLTSQRCDNSTTVWWQNVCFMKCCYGKDFSKMLHWVYFDISFRTT